MNHSFRRRRPSSSDSGKSNLSFEKLEVRNLLASVSLSGTELLIQGNPTDDTISLIGDASQSEFTVSVAGEPALTATYDYSDISSVTVFAGNGDDFVANTLEIPTIIHGEGGNDILRGGYVDDVITGGNGDDEILGRSGNDQIDGQGGVDLVFGGTGDDVITGGVGDDNLQGDQGDDQIDGQGGNDLIDGGLGDDEILGGIGDDEIHGQDGLDFVSGGVGNDIISGGDGDDELQGNEGDDQINGQDGNDLIWGSFGDDTLNGGLGNDTIYGQDGIDSLIGSFGSDRLIGGQGDDILRGGDGRDILSGGAGDDELIGGSGDDDLFGQGGADVLSGNSGDDLLDAGFDQVQDTLTGGLGLDQFAVLGFIGSGSLDVVTDRAGFETYNGYSGPLTPLVEFDGDKLLIRGMETDDKFEIFAVNGQDEFKVIWNHDHANPLGVFSNSVVDELFIDAGGGDDRIENINRSVIPMRVSGGDGNDTITGGLSADILNGGNGDDWIHGYDGDDQLNGDAGNDVIFGGNDLDTLLGGTGSDQLKGEHGDDILDAGTDSQPDTLWGDEGIDQFFADSTDIVQDRENNEVLALAGTSNDPDSTTGGGDPGGGDPGDGDPGDGDPGDGDPGDGDPGDDDPMTASIGDLVFEDLDEDGVFDPDETGIEGIVLRLLQEDVERATTTTDANGNYLFDGLVAGDYQVELDTNSLGDRNVTTNSIANVTVAEGEENTDADFGVEFVDDNIPTINLAGVLQSQLSDAFSKEVSETELTLFAEGFGGLESISSTVKVVDLGARKAFFTVAGISFLGPTFKYGGDFPSALNSDAAIELAALGATSGDVLHVVTDSVVGSTANSLPLAGSTASFTRLVVARSETGSYDTVGTIEYGQDADFQLLPMPFSSGTSVDPLNVTRESLFENSGVALLALDSFLGTQFSFALSSSLLTSGDEIDDSWSFTLFDRKYFLNPFNQNASWNPFNSALSDFGDVVIGQAGAILFTGEAFSAAEALAIGEAGNAGGVTGTKATVNASSDTLVGLVTLGTQDAASWGLEIEPTQADLDRGYMIAYASSRVGVEIGAGLATGGLSQAGKLGRVIIIVDVAGNGVGTSAALSDIAANGFTFENSTNAVANAAGLGSNFAGVLRASRSADDVIDAGADIRRSFFAGADFDLEVNPGRGVTGFDINYRGTANSGFIQTIFTDSTGELFINTISTAVNRQGLGTELFRRAIDAAEASGTRVTSLAGGLRKDNLDILTNGGLLQDTPAFKIRTALGFTQLIQSPTAQNGFTLIMGR